MALIGLKSGANCGGPLAGGQQAALVGAGIQFAAIGKAGGFQPELQR